MASPLDRFSPSSRFAFPDGSVLTVGTVTRDDHITKDVLISHEAPSDPDAALHILLPTSSVDHVIRALQERANEARFVNGEPILEYPELIRDFPEPKRKRKPKTRKSGQQSVGGDSGKAAADDGPTGAPQR